MAGLFHCCPVKWRGPCANADHDSSRLKFRRHARAWPGLARASTPFFMLNGSNMRQGRFTTERLCWQSSALPRGLLPEHGVDDGEELMSCGDEGKLGWLSCGAQPLVE